jgi:hypothetical protein
VVGVAALAVVAVLVPRATGRLAVVAAVAVALSGVAGPAAYAVQTAGTPHAGSIPTAGPASAGGGPGGFGPRGDGPGRSGPDRREGPGAAAPGGPDDAATVDPELVAALRRAGTTWAAATVGAQRSASLALASGASVMGIGGFTGADPAPTLEQFQAWVAAGEIRYFVPGPEGGRGPGGSGSATAITTWVEQGFTTVRIGGATVYDLNLPNG